METYANKTQAKTSNSSISKRKNHIKTRPTPGWKDHRPEAAQAETSQALATNSLHTQQAIQLQGMANAYAARQPDFRQKTGNLDVRTKILMMEQRQANDPIQNQTSNKRPSASIDFLKNDRSKPLRNKTPIVQRVQFDTEKEVLKMFTKVCKKADRDTRNIYYKYFAELGERRKWKGFKIKLWNIIVNTCLKHNEAAKPEVVIGPEQVTREEAYREDIVDLQPAAGNDELIAVEESSDSDDDWANYQFTTDVSEFISQNIVTTASPHQVLRTSAMGDCCAIAMKTQNQRTLAHLPSGNVDGLNGGAAALNQLYVDGRTEVYLVMGVSYLDPEVKQYMKKRIFSKLTFSENITDLGCAPYCKIDTKGIVSLE